MNLIVALLEAPRPLTQAEIRGKVAGYGHDDPESARRMFERDKDDLRSLGVPLETRALDAVGAEFGYIIDRDSYALDEVQLSADEVAALAVALRVTGEEAARLGFTKVAARAPDPSEAPAPPTRVDIAADALDGVDEALIARRTVTFDYTSASGAFSRRTVDPYGLIQRRGAWYLVGHDHDRDDLRAFRLDRCSGAVRPVGDPGAYEVPDGLDLSGLVSGPTVDGTDILVAIVERLAWELTRRGGTVEGNEPDGRVRVRLTDVDPDRALPWILGFGPDVEILGPAEVREEAVQRLEAVASR